MTEVLGATLPDSWSTASIKRVTSSLNRGSAPDYVDDGPVRAISQAANQSSGLDWTRTRFHKFNGDPTKLKGHLQAKDILVNSTGTGTLGRIGFFEGEPDEIPCMADSHVTIVRTDNDVLEPRFAYYWLCSQPFQEYIYAALVVGATNQIELNRDRLADAPVPVPCLSEQQRIADFLDAETSRIVRLVSLRQQQVELLEERESAQLDLAIDQLMSQVGAVPLRRFLWSVNQGASPQCDAVPAGDEEWGVLKVSCLRPGAFFPEENKRLPESTQPLRSHEVHEGDLLITRANTPQLVGSTAVVGKIRPKLLLSDKIFRVRLSDAMSPEFVAAVARGSRIRALCAATSNGASQSMANIRFEEVKSWPLPAASRTEQMEFVEAISRTRKQIDALRPAISRQLELLSERRQALITAAVTGQFDVTTASGRGVTE